MSDVAGTALIILGTALVTVLAVVAGFLVSTLLEVRTTARSLRDALDRLTPQAEAVLENLRRTSASAAEGAAAFSRISEALTPVAETAGRVRSLWGALAAGATLALYGVVRRRRAAR